MIFKVNSKIKNVERAIFKGKRKNIDIILKALFSLSYTIQNKNNNYGGCISTEMTQIFEHSQKESK